MADLLLSDLIVWSVQATVLITIVGIGTWVVRVDTPGVRYGWFRLALIGCLLLPIIQPWSAKQPPGFISADQHVNLLPTATFSDVAHTVSVPVIGPRSGFPATAVVLSTLALGILLRLGWLGGGLVRLQRLRRSGTAHQLNDELQGMLTGRAEVRFVSSAWQPMTFGIRRAVILMPSTLLTLPQHLQRTVLAHELWHVRRRDWGWTMAEEVLRSVLWFHPAIWWLISQVQIAREQLVDELTVLSTNAKVPYLEALVTFADRPAFAPAASFASRRQLYQRILLISKGANMSSTRIVAAGAGLLVAVGLGGRCVVAAFPMVGVVSTSTQAQAPPERPPAALKSATARELELSRLVAGSPPAEPSLFLELAKLQEDRGAVSAAEKTLQSLCRARPDNAEPLLALAALYRRTNYIDQALDTLERAAAINRLDPNAQHMLAADYWDASRAQGVSRGTKARYLLRGISAENRALAIWPDFAEALAYKSELLREEASLENGATQATILLAQADALRTRVLALGQPQPQRYSAEPSLPSPSAPQVRSSDHAVYVGGDVAAPLKIRDMRPEYSPMARSSGIHGTVGVEVWIDERGDVADARVVHSIPLLDQAALDAVRQWKFRPTLINGKATPVVMTVPVEFRRP